MWSSGFWVAHIPFSSLYWACQQKVQPNFSIESPTCTKHNSSILLKRYPCSLWMLMMLSLRSLTHLPRQLTLLLLLSLFSLVEHVLNKTGMSCARRSMSFFSWSSFEILLALFLGLNFIKNWRNHQVLKLQNNTWQFVKCKNWRFYFNFCKDSCMQVHCLLVLFYKISWSLETR